MSIVATNTDYRLAQCERTYVPREQWDRPYYKTSRDKLQCNRTGYTTWKQKKNSQRKRSQREITQGRTEEIPGTAAACEADLRITIVGHTTGCWARVRTATEYTAQRNHVIYGVIDTMNTNSDEHFDNNVNDKLVKGQNEPEEAPQKYGFDRIVGHIGNGTSKKFVERW